MTSVDRYDTRDGRQLVKEKKAARSICMSLLASVRGDASGDVGGGGVGRELLRDNIFKSSVVEYR